MRRPDTNFKRGVLVGALVKRQMVLVGLQTDLR